MKSNSRVNQVAKAFYTSKVKIVLDPKSKKTNSNTFELVDELISDSKNQNTFDDNKNLTDLRNTRPASLTLPQRKLSQSKKIAKQSSFILNQLNSLKKCQSKIDFQYFLENTSRFLKLILQFYLTECFHFHVFSRKLKSPKHLFSKRGLLFKIIDNPEMLKQDCGFNNNSISNFSTGASLFLKKHLKSVIFSVKEYYK